MTGLWLSPATWPHCEITWRSSRFRTISACEHRRLRWPGSCLILYEIAARAARSNVPTVRLAGAALGGAVEDFLGLLAEVFLRMPDGDKAAVLRAYAREQMSDMVRVEHTTIMG